MESSEATIIAMMISLRAESLAKRFHRQWIFKDISFSLVAGDKLLITGSNGSGKSTLLRILSGQLNPSKGGVHVVYGKRKIHPDSFYRYISWSGPYMDLYPDLTLGEAVDMHYRFRDCLFDKKAEVISIMNLQAHIDKPLRNFSSGMLHRVKVGLAVFSKSKILLLDEATTNMDQENSGLVIEWIQKYQEERILVYAGNKPEEFVHFEQQLIM